MRPGAGFRFAAVVPAALPPSPTGLAWLRGACGEGGPRDAGRR